MSELDEIFFEHGVILHPSDIEMDLERKTYFKQAIEAYISKHYIKKDKIVILEADIAYAIGHGKGCGHPITYLEKRYPELHKEKLNIGDK